MSIKLLIVNDSELTLTGLRGLLDETRGQIDLHQAPALAHALVNMGRKPPGLVVLDLELPDSLDAQVTNTLRERLPGLRVASLSNDASAFVKALCSQAGADWLFDKAGHFEDLLDVARVQACAN
jgi:DNA-binding NarL/FixJ family response regulator